MTPTRPQPLTRAEKIARVLELFAETQARAEQAENALATAEAELDDFRRAWAVMREWDADSPRTHAADTAEDVARAFRDALTLATRELAEERAQLVEAEALAKSMAEQVKTLERERDEARNRLIAAKAESDETYTQRDSARAEADGLRGQVAALVAALGDVPCRNRYVDHPDDYTCLSQVSEAQDYPARFTDDFRARILDGKELCSGCRARRVLADTRAAAEAHDSHLRREVDEAWMKLLGVARADVGDRSEALVVHDEKTRADARREQAATDCEAFRALLYDSCVTEPPEELRQAIAERDARRDAATRAPLIDLLTDARDCIEDLIFKPPHRSKDENGLSGRIRLVLDEISKLATPGAPEKEPTQDHDAGCVCDDCKAAIQAAAKESGF